jgi:hypothetical protein
LALAPDSADAHLTYGTVLFAMRAPEHALREFEFAVSLDGNLATAHAYIGLMKVFLGRATAKRWTCATSGLRLSTTSIFTVSKGLWPSAVSRCASSAWRRRTACGWRLLLGRGMQLTGILRDLAQDAVRQRLYLPCELLRAHRIFATMPSYVLAQPALPQVCNALAERAAAYFAQAERAIVARPRLPMLAATAMLSGYRTLLEGLLSRGWMRLDEPAHIPVWHQTALRIGRSLVGR